MTQTHSELELDALREIANIGCGHAATALSRMVGGKTVCIDVPRIVTGRKEEILPLVEEDAPAIAAAVGIEGSVTGRMLLVWPYQDACELASLLLGAVGAAPLEEPRSSALAELANVVCSACLSAIGTLTRLQLLPTAPQMIRGTGRDVVSAFFADQRAGPSVVVVETRLHGIHVPPLSGRLMVVPDRAALGTLLRAIGL
jgi:chemotaxis protein CheC